MSKKVINLIFLIVVSLFVVNVTKVNAKVLKIDEVKDGFNNSATVKEFQTIGINLSSKIDEKNKKLDIYAKEDSGNEEKIFSFNYSDDYVEFDNRNTVITEEIVSDSVATFLCLGGVMETIFALSGFENKTFKEDAVLDSYDVYGIQIESEKYNFSNQENGGSSTLSGDYIKYFKMSLDTDKISAFMNKYGVDAVDDNKYDEEIIKLVPIVEAKDVKETSITIFTKVVSDKVDIPENIMCDIYRSTKKDGEYKKISDSSVNCSGGIGITDEGLTAGTTYYYKAVIMGGNKFSESILVTTKSAAAETEAKKDETVENPKTGIVSNTVLIVSGLLLTSGIYIILRKKNIINKI